MFDRLETGKIELVEVLGQLPSSIRIPDEDCTHLTEVFIGDEVNQDIKNVNDFWDFIQEYNDTSVIALVGMVNAGKSALGNHYARMGESEIFEEGPIRQTSKSTQVRLDQNQLLIDLPGLGSVLSEEDDQLVKDIVRRANLLLIVIGINQPITEHLYEFIQSDNVLKTWDAQRIVIVLNKLDILDSYPETHRKRTLERYTDFLTNGNSEMGFRGISELFNYEVPIIPFSVVHARNQIEMWREATLRQSISVALEGSANTSIIRAREELATYYIKYARLVSSYLLLKQKEEEESEAINDLIPRLLKDMERVVLRELDSLFDTLSSIRESCFDAMQTYQPDNAEYFWRGSEYDRKKNNLKACREKYKEKICSTFDNFSYNFRDALTSIVKGTFGSCGSVYISSSDGVHESLKAGINDIWDAFDDVYFYDHDANSVRVQQKLSKSGSHFEAAAVEINEWKSGLIERVFDAAQDALKRKRNQKVSEYRDASNLLEDFCQAFIETDFFHDCINKN